VTGPGDGLVERLARLVAAVSDGEVTAAAALAAEAPLPALGFTSLSQLRLVDAVEREFRVTIDLSAEGLAALDDVHALAAAISASAGRS
jgi:acyl carrier protein